MNLIPDKPKHKPIVLSFSGHDPSGGAGIQADIGAISALGCQACTILSCLTVQNSSNVTSVQPIATPLILDQFESLIADYSIAAIKIGLLGTIENVTTAAAFASRLPDTPLVLDPILAAGGGQQLADTTLQDAIIEHLLPHTTLLTPNSPEARILGRSNSLTQCAERLLEHGCQAVLITGTHEDTEAVTNTLYQKNQPAQISHWPRLPHSYHGSGCTLASACAAELAKSANLETACRSAQEFTWASLSSGWRPGKGQHIPDPLQLR